MLKKYLFVSLFLSLLALQAFAQGNEMPCPHPDTSLALEAANEGKSLMRSDMQGAIKATARAKDVYIRIKCWEQVVKTSFNLYVMYNMAKDPAKAASELKYAQKISVQLPDESKWKGKITHVIGETYMRKMALDTARMYLLEAKVLLKMSQAWKEYVDACRTLAQVAYYEQNYRLMERYLNEGFETTKDQLDNNQSQIRSILQLYGALYYRTGDYETALEKTLEGLEIVQKSMNTRNDTALIASYYNNISLFYIELGDVAKAEDYCNNALTYSLQLKDNYKAATIYLNLAEFFYNKKQFGKANYYYNKGLDILKLVNKYEANQSDIDRTFIQINMGKARAAYEIDKKQEAFEALELNLQRHIRESYKLEVTLMVKGNLLRLEKKYDEAEANLTKALSVALSLYPSGKHPDIGDIYTDLAKLYRAKGNDKKAYELLEKASDALIMKMNGDALKDLSVVSDKDLLLDICELQADIKLAEGNLKEAYALIMKATQITDELRNSFKTEGSKLFFLQRVIPVYEKTIEIAIKLNEKTPSDAYLEKAFELVEKSKSMLLLDALKTEEARDFGNIPDELLREERRLTRELAKNQKMLFEAQISGDKKAINELQQIILTSKRDAQKLQDTLEANYNSYYRLKYDDKSATIAQIQGFLSNDQRLLEYFVGNTHTYLFSIGKKDIKVFSTDRSLETDNTIKKLRSALTNNSALADKEKVIEIYAQLVESAYSIFNTYVKQGISGKEKSLLIIPDGLLNYIPFDVLLTEAVDAKTTSPDFRSLPYLLQKYSIHYHYSSSLMLFERQKSKNNGQILALAPTFKYEHHHDNEDPRQHKIRSNVDELPGAKQEVRALSTVFKGTYLYDNDANEANLKRISQQESSSVIHLAMHGWVDAESPQYSCLVLSHVHDETEDNLLHAYELNLLKLKADLVVLSACETGFGKYERGEGVVSIGRGFMYAGIPSLVMTLWPINDQATASLMTDFYEQLSKGKTKSAAMRQAKLNYLEAASAVSAHPFFWASFMTLGDDAPIRLRKLNEWSSWLIWGGASLLFILVAGVFTGRIRKSILINKKEMGHRHD